MYTSQYRAGDMSDYYPAVSYIGGSKNEINDYLSPIKR